MKNEKLIEIEKVHPVKGLQDGEKIQNKQTSNGVGKIIFVGDTHGDLEVSKKIIKNYLPAHQSSSLQTMAGEPARQNFDKNGKPENIVVFLGDYVDRGPYSKENLDYLLEIKIKYPNQIFLLQGNHEGHHILKFSPADFWEDLSEKEYQTYSSIVEKFPLVAVTDDIIASHGALPDVESLEEINKIKLGSQAWQQITWGDFSEKLGEYLGLDPFTGRPQFGKDYFLKIMKRFNKKILIRSHQPHAPQFMFNDRCLTIFTSSSYGQERTIAIADFTKPIKNAKDLEIKRI